MSKKKLIKSPIQRVLETTGNTTNFILLIICIVALIFTTIMIILFCKYQETPDTLIISVFGFISVEGGVLGGIKITKTKNTKKEDVSG